MFLPTNDTPGWPSRKHVDDAVFLNVNSKYRLPAAPPPSGTRVPTLSWSTSQRGLEPCFFDPDADWSDELGGADRSDESEVDGCCPDEPGPDESRLDGSEPDDPEPDADGVAVAGLDGLDESVALGEGCWTGEESPSPDDVLRPLPLHPASVRHRSTAANVANVNDERMDFLSWDL